MKKTTIIVRGFDCDFEVTIQRKEFLDFESAENYIKKDIVSTASVKGLIYHNEQEKLLILNQNYICPNYKFKNHESKKA
jgi:hypothetical protein